jgi:hypothetical protein
LFCSLCMSGVLFWASRTELLARLELKRQPDPCVLY